MNNKTLLERFKEHTETTCKDGFHLELASALKQLTHAKYTDTCFLKDLIDLLELKKDQDEDYIAHQLHKYSSTFKYKEKHCKEPEELTAMFLMRITFIEISRFFKPCFSKEIWKRHEDYYDVPYSLEMDDVLKLFSEEHHDLKRTA